MKHIIMSNGNSYSLLAILKFIAVFLTFPILSDGARILGYFPTITISQTIIHCAVADALAQAGHDVTVIGAVPNVNKNAKYKYIHIEIPGFTTRLTKNFVNKQKSVTEGVLNFSKMFINIASKHMQHPEMKKFLQEHGENAFDLVILGYLMNDYQMGLAAHFKCPIILSVTVQTMPPINRLFGNPNEISYVGVGMLEYKDPLEFWARVSNFFFGLFLKFLIVPLTDYYNNIYYKDQFPSPRYPPFDEIRKNASLVFTNHHQVSQGPIRPNVPAIIEVGGIQIKEKPNPLPNHIAAMFENGVIFFSLGSTVQGNALDPKKARIMFNVFSKLPYKVLWKWGDSDFPGSSPNIVYESWVPQDDVLAQPNLKLFITNGGKGSLVEAQYHGVPMVGMPLFADQPANVAIIEKSGFGVRVDYFTLTEQSFLEAILEVLQNPKYKETIQRFSKLYRDRPITARESVVYWTDYVLRYNGAMHLQSPAVHLNVFQLLSLDVIAFFLSTTLITVILTIKIYKHLCCRCSSRCKKNVHTTKSKKNK